MHLVYSKRRITFPVHRTKEKAIKHKTLRNIFQKVINLSTVRGFSQRLDIQVLPLGKLKRFT